MRIGARPPGARPGPARRPHTSQHTGYRGRFLILEGERVRARSLPLVRTRLGRLLSPGGGAGGEAGRGHTRRRAACSVAAGEPAARYLNGCTRRESKSATFLTLIPRA